MNIEQELKELLKQATEKHSLNSICQAADIDYATLHKWYSGRQKTITLSSAGKLIEYLGISLLPQTECEKKLAELKEEIESLKAENEQLKKVNLYLKGSVDTLERIAGLAPDAKKIRVISTEIRGGCTITTVCYS